MSNANPYNYDPNQPPYQGPAKSGTNVFLIVGIVMAVVALPIILLCGVALLLPAVQAAREAARRMQCSNNMKQIALAMHNYEAVHKSFPPAYTVDASGQPLHSWRTLILPYMEQQALYAQIDLTKPWNDPVNQSFNDIVIPAYVCPSTKLDPGFTTYVAVVDPSSVFPGSQPILIREILDGTSNTLLVAETNVVNAVHWMSPQDISISTFLDTSSRGAHPGGCNCSFCDGSVNFISDNTDPATRKGIVTKDGDEAIGL